MQLCRFYVKTFISLCCNCSLSVGLLIENTAESVGWLVGWFMGFNVPKRLGLWEAPWWRASDNFGHLGLTCTEVAQYMGL
uniref:Uncharacterized protein n=1 Tax=Rhipicephalus appendiculatus TaxID=34631 RepID=A0A131YET3_RHIAP